VRSGEAGSVTVELAVGLSTVTVVVALILATAAASVARIRCIDAARIGARTAVLGEDDRSVTQAAQHAAGGHAIVTIERDDSWVTVIVEMPVQVGPFHGTATSGPVSGLLEP
jgi:hypothetical protein